MRNFFFLPSIILLLFSCSGCGYICKEGNGKISEEGRTVTGFSAIEMNGNFDIFITKSTANTVIVEAEENLHEYIDIYVQDAKLYLRTKECLSTTRDMRVFVTMNKIEELVINGAGDITCKDTFTIQDLQIKVNGTGDVNMLTNAEKITANINGAGDIKLAGRANELNLKINGTGDLKAFELPVMRGSVKINGAGDAEISAEEALDVAIFGAGDVYYKGKNTVVKSKITGAGEVVRK